MKDAEGKYIFATHYWHHIHGRNEIGWTIRGKTDIEIRKDKSNALKAFETDKKIIETGKGMTYTIEVNKNLILIKLYILMKMEKLQVLLHL